MNQEIGFSVTNEIAQIGQSYQYGNLPPEVIVVAKHCLLDWLGVTVAGAQAEASTLLRNVLQQEGGKSAATYIGTTEKGPLLSTAEANGTAAHAIDFDDLHVPAHLPNGAIGHPSAPVIGALLPLSEAKALGGRDFIAALVSGIETECRVGLLVAPGHYAAGWHSTATIGTFGAAAACAHALRLSPAEWLHTLGLAGMQAQGLKSMFGTMGKPFQVGKASRNGLEAALLAAHGYTSNPHILEADQGFSKTQSSTYTEALPEGYQILDTRFKKFACCGGTHPTIEGARSLMREYRLEPDMIEQVEVQVHPSRDKACNIQTPRTPQEGKFSLRYVTALALNGSDLGEQAFNEANLRDRQIASILGRITVRLVNEIEEDASTVRIILRDGRTVEDSKKEGPAETDKQKEWSELAAKFTSLTVPVIGKQSADELLTCVAQLEETEVMAEITSFCVAEAEKV